MQKSIILNRIATSILVQVILTSIVTYHIFSQSESESLAKIGKQVITTDEFVYRYELTPQMFREQKNSGDELKQEFLYTLIAEKLLALFGETISLDTAEIVKYTLKMFEEMFVRDELYKQVVVEKAKFKADSLLGFYITNASEAKLKYVRIDNYDKAERIYSLLQKGTPFDFFSADTSLSGGDIRTIKFGQSDELIENEILTSPENGFTKPMLMYDQWYIFSVIKKFYPIIDRQQGWESEYNRLKKLAKERTERVYYQKYMNTIFGNLSVKANGKLLKIFAEEVYDILNKKMSNDKERKKHFLEVSDLVFIIDKLNNETLNSTFVQLPAGAIPLKDFINFFRFENVSFDSVDYQQVLDAFNGKAKKFIEYKILAHEGYKLGLDKSTEVRKKFDMWKQNYYYQLVMTEFMDSAYVSDEDIKSYYNQVNKGKFNLKMLNVIEILVPDLETAEKVLNELEKGVEFRNLAVQYSADAQPTGSNVESGFKPLSYSGEIGSALDKIAIGDIYGPVKVTKGYSIFKLIDVKNDSLSGSQSFAEIKKELEPELRYKKMKNSLNQFIAKLAKQNNITINKELLSSIRTTAHNSVVFNLLGFGGKILAIPLISINADWVEFWLNSLKVIP